MLFSLIHPEMGSSSQNKLLAFEAHRLIPSLFGYHHLTPKSNGGAPATKQSQHLAWVQIASQKTLAMTCTLQRHA